MTRRLLWGTGLIVLHAAIAVAYAGLGLPLLPVFDGIAPPEPYRWVEPPAQFRDTNEPPLPGALTTKLETVGGGISAATDDAQAQLIFPGGSIPDSEEDRSLRVQIEPLDPASVGPPPSGLRFSSNAYEMTAEYLPSGDPVEPAAPVTPVLRYATHTTELLRWTGSEWERIEEATAVQGTLQVYGPSDEIGIFVAAGRPPPPPREEGVDWVPLAGYGAAGVLVVGTLAWVWWRRRREARTRAARRKKGKQGKKGRR